MKKVIAWLLVLALTAAVSIGATLAYLTDTDEDVNVMTIGKVKIDQLEYERIDDETQNEDAEVQEFHDNKPLIPAVTKDDFDYTPGSSYVDWEQIGKDGYTSTIWDPAKINNEVDKMVFVKNKGDYDAYVRSVFAFEAGKYTSLDEFQKMVHLNLNETDYTWEWIETPVTIGESTYFVATATYNNVLAPGALTEISLSQIALDKTATNEDVEAFGETYQVLVKSQGIQADGFADADSALNEGFGEITESNIPWENDNPTKGIDLRTALHYYEGGSTKITSKVTNVIFGLNSDHSAIADTYDATLVDVEQDVPVYAYYVPNGSYYDVYFLANDDIYLPVNCAALFSNMSQLISVDTKNMNTSRVVDMTDMFYRCGKLQSIDTANWDVSNVETLLGTFCRCTSLTSLDLTGWDTSNVTDMKYVFSNSSALVTIKGLDTWDTSNVTEMNEMFGWCRSLVDLSGISNWDTSKVTTLYQTFTCCESLTELNIGNWDTSSLTDLHFTFKGARSLTELDLSGWDTSKVTTFSSLFSSENSNDPDMQQKIVKLENWDTSSAKSFYCMFYGCGQITEMDLSSWNTANLESVSRMFADCYKLEKVDFTGWKTPKLKTVDALFNNCSSLKRVDVSNLDTANVVEFSQTFEYCYSLEEIIGLDKWVTTSGQDFGEMFSSCGSLTSLDLSSFDTTHAQDSYVNTSNGDGNDRFHYFLTGCNSLEKITLGENFSFDGDGSFTKWTFAMPSATNVNGWDGYWYDADGNAYAPSDIPEETARTYYAVKPVTP